MDGKCVWFWIGSHGEYDKLVGRQPVNKALQPTSRTPEKGRSKVLDFGVAKLVAEAAPAELDQPGETMAALTMAGTIIGTPAYMAPEQVSASALDPRTDVFALGVIAYEMLCGELPFSRGSLTDVILAQARGAQPLTERDPDIPAAVDRAVRRALEMTPDERPATPHAFASDVLQALATV